jgi:hypothetical protein
MRSYKPHNRLQVWEDRFQELRLAITNNELIKISYASWKSSGIQLWSSLKISTKFRNQNFKVQEWEFLPRVR